MIFSGDIACPNLVSLPNLKIPDNLKNKVWFSNLEGAIEEDSKNLIDRFVVFNDYKSIKEIKKNINLKGLALANNHITDTSSISKTIQYLKRIKIYSTGAGTNLSQAQRACILNDDSNQVVILNFGWRSIGCVAAESNKQGVNPYNKKNIFNQVNKYKYRYENAKIIVYLHCNYELELYPQPLDRSLANSLIDLGVDAVICSHTHRVQGAEIYQGKPIIYGLGNWIFPQHKFWNGNLKFPEFCDLQLAFEIDWKSNKFICHYFNYNKHSNEIVFLESCELKFCEKIKRLTPFANLSSNEYAKWFKSMRYQKKMLPVFYYDDSKFISDLKNYWIKIRHWFIMFLLFTNIKK